MTIGIIDVGIGNTGSLRGALYSLGWDAILIAEPEGLQKADRLILPGVGSFAEAVRRLEQADLIDALRNYAATAKPILGICLGMQLLATSGVEGGLAEGLNLIPGQVRPLEIEKKYRVPHVGWNSVEVKRHHPLLKRIRSGIDFYFVHSFYFQAHDEGDVVATTDYGFDFPTFIARDNVVGTQFHVEKSQRNGLQILDNFCSWDGRC